MENLKKMLANAPVFGGLYVVFMIPTYLLPYLGSNSSAMRIAGALSGVSFNFPFLLHLTAMLALVVLCWLRGAYVDKKWLPVLPILAIVFDFVPGLNFIPLVPTAMHLLAVILGVAASKTVVVAPSR